MPGTARHLVHADDSNSHPRTIYLNALLHQPEVAMLRFPERLDGVPFAEMYVDQTVVEEQRERQPAPAAEADTEQALHAEMVREVVRQVEVDLWQALTERSRVVVEAPAWTGKSTLCRWVTHQCYARTTWLPILIPFRDFAQSEKSLRQYLDEDYTTWLGLSAQPLTVELSDGNQHTRTVGHWLDDEWQAGKALVILDGVDEEFVPERRKKALDFVTMSLAARPRVLLTSRPLGVSAAPGFAQVQLQEFTPRQIDRLVRQCGAIMGAPDKAEQFLTAMQRTENLRVRPLAGRPGHLVQMFAAYVYDGILLTAEDDLMQHVAERRLALARPVIPLLQPDDLSYKRQMVEALAFHLLFCRRGQAQNDAQMLSLVRQTLREVKVNGTPVYAARDGGTVLEDLCRNSGLLKQTNWGAYKAYEWESVLWLQFFAVSHIARKLREHDTCFTRWVYAKREGKQSALQCPVCTTSVPSFSNYFWHGDWQDTVTLLAGLLGDTTILLRHIQAEPHDIFHQMTNLAARCLGRSRAVAPKVAEQIVATAGRAWMQALREHRSLDVAALQALARARHRQWAVQGCVVLDLGLKANDWLVRVAAAEALGRYPTPEAVVALCGALRDEDESVRAAAAEGLGWYPTSEAAAALCAALRDEMGLVRMAAVEALGRSPTSEAVAGLFAALRDEDGEIREFATNALGQHPTPEAVAALCAALWDEDLGVKESAASALVQHPTPEGVTTLGVALREEDKWVREAVARALYWYPMPEAIVALCAAFLDEDLGRRTAAAQAPGWYSTPEVVTALCMALRDKDEWVRAAAAKALSWYPTREAIMALAVTLREDEDSIVREAAAEVLGQHPTSEGVATLGIALREDKDSEVRGAAAKALGQHPTPEVIAALCVALREDQSATVRGAAAKALVQHPTPEVIAALCVALREDQSATARAATAEALRQSSLTPEAVATLRAALQDESREVCEAVAETLGETQAPDLVPPLLAVARSWREQRIWEALWHLSQDTKIRIGANGQWHPLPPVEPAFQNVTERQQVTSF